MKRINKNFLLQILLIGVIILIVNVWFYQLCIVKGDSMFPTLKNGNIVCTKKYNLNLNYDDIVVIKKNDKVLIKRLVGLPNDEIIIVNNYLYVNGKKHDNLYIENNEDVNNEICLKSNEYFVLGDNRKDSIDSRFNEIGIIYKNEIQGKVIFNKGGI